MSSIFTHRFCRQCMSDVDLNPIASRLALFLDVTSQNRLVSCDDPRHSGAAILVDSTGLKVTASLKPPTNTRVAVAGHSLFANTSK